MKQVSLRITEDDIKHLNKAELIALSQCNPYMSYTKFESLTELFKKVNHNISVPEAQMVLGVLNKVGARALLQSVQVQDAALLKQEFTTYTKEAMVVAGPVEDTKVLLSRVPIVTEVVEDVVKKPRLGSDLLSCLIGGLTKWSGAFIEPAIDYSALTKKNFRALTNPYGIMLVARQLGEYFCMKQISPGKGGMKGRAWVFYLMERFQTMDEEYYKNIHTFVSLQIFKGVSLKKKGKDYTVVTSDFMKDCFVTAKGTTENPVCVIWTKMLKRDHAAMKADKADPLVAYESICTSLAFRGGLSSPLGSLLLSNGSWGFPSKATAEMEIILSVVLGMEVPFVLEGLSPEKCLIVIRAMEYWKVGVKGKFLIPSNKWNVFNSMMPNWFVKKIPDGVYRLKIWESSISTSVKQMKHQGALKKYDQQKLDTLVFMPIQEELDDMGENGAILGEWVPPVTYTGFITEVRAPYDGLGLYAKKKHKLARAVFDDKDDLVLERYEGKSYVAPEWWEWIVKCNNSLNGAFLGPKLENNYGRANLLVPLKNRRLVVSQFDGAEYMDGDEVDYALLDELDTQEEEDEERSEDVGEDEREEEDEESGAEGDGDSKEEEEKDEWAEDTRDVKLLQTKVWDNKEKKFVAATLAKEEVVKKESREEKLVEKKGIVPLPVIVNTPQNVEKQQTKGPSLVGTVGKEKEKEDVVQKKEAIKETSGPPKIQGEKIKVPKRRIDTQSERKGKEDDVEGENPVGEVESI